MSFLELITTISIIIGGNAYHFDRTDNYNEENHIRGIEIQLEDYEVGFKKFTNSYSKPSNALTLNWKKRFEDLGIGISGGIADNYPGIEAFIAPVVSYKYKNIEAEATCSNTLCVYQLKLTWKL